MQLGHTPTIQYTKINPFSKQAHTLVILEMDVGEFTPSSEKPFSPGMFRGS